MSAKIKKHINLLFILIISQLLFNVKSIEQEYTIEYFLLGSHYQSYTLFHLPNNQPFPKVFINGTDKTSTIINEENEYYYMTESSDKLYIKLVWNTKLTNMKSMFCALHLSFINFTNFDSSEVTNMENLFENAEKLKTISFNNFNTSKVTSFKNMFKNCEDLVSLDLSSFDTKNVEYMDYMFANCQKLNYLNIENFITNKVQTMEAMFYYCSLLSSLNLSSFDTKNVINMNSMFYYCSRLSSLNLSSFDTKNVINMNSMFLIVILYLL